MRWILTTHWRLDPSRRLGIGCGHGALRQPRRGHRKGAALGGRARSRRIVSRRARQHDGSRLAPHSGDGRFRGGRGSGRAVALDAGTDAGRVGVGYSHAAGNRQCILDGALTKRMQAGQAASAGVFSAVLAQTGSTGARNIFDGRFGFFELYQPYGYDAAVLLRDLGTAFGGEALSYKPYPCGRPLHAAIDAALAARAQLPTERPADIGGVTIEADPAGHGDQFERGPAKRRPTEVVEAQFAQP